MSPDPNRPIRKHARLREYDYSTPAAYYVTICTFDKRMIFGNVTDGHVHPSTLGQVAIEWWNEIPSMWPGVELDAFVLMPNHIHGILNIIEAPTKQPKLGRMVSWYKAAVTKANRRRGGDPNAVIWQSKFYDHVVRDERDLERIRAYIAFNPGRWSEDEYYGG